MELDYHNGEKVDSLPSQNAIQFTATAPRYLATKIIGKFLPFLYTSRLSCVSLKKVKIPSLPGPDWVRIKVIYSGICGSDLNLIHLHDTPYTSPFVSFPFTIGHEILGEIIDKGPSVEGFKVGDRIVVDPGLSCRVRGIRPLCRSCQVGEFSRCENTNFGCISHGLITGSCRDTGGGWSSILVAHHYQLFHVPNRVSDENAVLVDSICSSFHSVIRNFPDDSDICLVIGLGIVGLGIIIALRALGSCCRIIALAKYQFQAELTRKYGANVTISMEKCSGYLNEIAEITGACVYKPLLGKKVLVGGADIVFECVGSSTSIDDALRSVRAGGKVILLGLAGIVKNVDWTPIWLKEIKIIGTISSSLEQVGNRKIRAHALVLELMEKGAINIAELVNGKYKLTDYKQAIKDLRNRQETKIVKAVFELHK